MTNSGQTESAVTMASVPDARSGTDTTKKRSWSDVEPCSTTENVKLTVDMLLLIELPTSSDANSDLNPHNPNQKNTIFWPCVYVSSPDELEPLMSKYKLFCGGDGNNENDNDESNQNHQQEEFQIKKRMMLEWIDHAVASDDCSGLDPVAVLLGPNCPLTLKQRTFHRPTTTMKLYPLSQYMRLFLAQRGRIQQGFQETAKQLMSLMTQLNQEKITNPPTAKVARVDTAPPIVHNDDDENKSTETMQTSPPSTSSTSPAAKVMEQHQVTPPPLSKASYPRPQEATDQPVAAPCKQHHEPVVQQQGMSSIQGRQSRECAWVTPITKKGDNISSNHHHLPKREKGVVKAKAGTPHFSETRRFYDENDYPSPLQQARQSSSVVSRVTDPNAAPFSQQEQQEQQEQQQGNKQTQLVSKEDNEAAKIASVKQSVVAMPRLTQATLHSNQPSSNVDAASTKQPEASNEAPEYDAPVKASATQRRKNNSSQEKPRSSNVHAAVSAHSKQPKVSHESPDLDGQVKSSTMNQLENNNNNNNNNNFQENPRITDPITQPATMADVLSHHVPKQTPTLFATHESEAPQAEAKAPLPQTSTHALEASKEPASVRQQVCSFEDSLNHVPLQTQEPATTPKPPEAMSDQPTLDILQEVLMPAQPESTATPHESRKTDMIDPCQAPPLQNQAQEEPKESKEPKEGESFSLSVIVHGERFDNTCHAVQVEKQEFVESQSSMQSWGGEDAPMKTDPRGTQECLLLAQAPSHIAQDQNTRTGHSNGKESAREASAQEYNTQEAAGACPGTDEPSPQAEPTTKSERLSPPPTRQYRFVGTDPPTHPVFADVKGLLEKGGFSFPERLYCRPNGNPAHNKCATKYTDFFDNENDFRQNLSTIGLCDNQCWSASDKSKIHQWVRMAIIKSADLCYDLPESVRGKKRIKAAQAINLLFKIGFKHRKGPCSYFYCYPGVDPKHGGVMGLNMFESDLELQHHLAKHGLPAVGCDLTRIDDVKLVALEYYLSTYLPEETTFLLNDSTKENDIA
ncbi:hypothetical protein ACA910_012063 [Epithemia clementina (nom. ined.)]